MRFRDWWLTDNSFLHNQVQFRQVTYPLTVLEYHCWNFVAEMTFQDKIMQIVSCIIQVESKAG